MSHGGKKCSCGCSSQYSVVVTVPADGEDGTVHEVGVNNKYKADFDQYQGFKSGCYLSTERFSGSRTLYLGLGWVSGGTFTYNVLTEGG